MCVCVGVGGRKHVCVCVGVGVCIRMCASKRNGSIRVEFALQKPLWTGTCYCDGACTIVLSEWKQLKVSSLMHCVHGELTEPGGHVHVH